MYRIVKKKLAQLNSTMRRIKNNIFGIKKIHLKSTIHALSHGIIFVFLKLKIMCINNAFISLLRSQKYHFSFLLTFSFIHVNYSTLKKGVTENYYHYKTYKFEFSRLENIKVTVFIAAFRA